MNCCTAACESEPHYEMIDVTLADYHHAWVCCAIRDILIRQLVAAIHALSRIGPIERVE